MKNSIIPVELYPNIFKHLPWTSLNNMKKINQYFYRLAQEELKKRWRSDQPLGDPKCKFIIITQGIALENIFCETDKTKVWISPKDWQKNWFQEIFEKYFSYSLETQGYIITNNLFRELIKYINHKKSLNSPPIDQFRQTIVFSNKTGKLRLKTFY